MLYIPAHGNLPVKNNFFFLKKNLNLTLVERKVTFLGTVGIS